MPDANQSITLSKKQQECIAFQPKGHLLVRGVAGSGKTTVLVERARWLAEKDPGSRIHVISYNSPLSRYIKHLAQKTAIGTPPAVTTFHGWCINILRGHGWLGHLNFASEGIAHGSVSFAKNIICKRLGLSCLPMVEGNNDYQKRQNLDRFLQEEIRWIKRNGMERSEYLRCERLGRGGSVRVSKQHRPIIYDVLEQYDTILRAKHHCIDFDDAANILWEHLRSVSASARPDHVLVDEAQDLSHMQLSVLAGLAGKSLTICADVGQKIYATNFTWRGAGIEITGGRTKPLLNTFRSTREIIMLAKDFQAKDPDLAKQDGFIPPDLPEVSGLKPLLHRCGDWNSAQRWVLLWARKLLTSFPTHTIGVIARSEDRIQDLLSLFSTNNVPVSLVKSDDDGVDLFCPGVKLSTYHSAKGLEFDHVIVCDLKQNWLPFSSSFLSCFGADAKEALTRERMLLYVAMTRAKLTLSLVAINPESSFISELDPELYQRV